MDAFLQPIHLKKFHAECSREKKYRGSTYRKKKKMNYGVEKKKFMHIPNHPPP